MAKKPRHGFRLTSSLTPPSLRNGRSCNSLETTRKSRLETLEDRRLLTFPTGATSSTSLVGTWQPESAFGDNATKTAAQTGSGYNNNDGTGSTAGAVSPERCLGLRHLRQRHQWRQLSRDDPWCYFHSSLFICGR